MELEKYIKISVYIHAAFGGLALFSGLIAIIAKKGSKLHKKAGKIFYFTMLASVFLSLIISVLPAHENSFLFSIGIFSLYFLITGYRCLQFKNESVNLKTNILIAYISIITGLLMILYPILFKGIINLVLLVFGFIAIITGIRELYLFKNKEKLKEKWLRLHIVKMVNGYIASVTAFFVVSNVLSGLYNWFVPGIIGGLYITFWMIKLKKNIKVEFK